MADNQAFEAWWHGRGLPDNLKAAFFMVWQAALASRPAEVDEPEDLLLVMWNLGYRPGAVVEKDYGKPWATRAIIKKVYEHGGLDLEVDGELDWSSVRRCKLVGAAP